MLEKLKTKKEYLIIIIVAILIMIPYISNNYTDAGDVNYHMSNVYARYSKLSQGDFSSQKVLPIIARNFGYGTGIFYPGLAHTITAMITLILGGNITLAFKIVHFVVYVISAIMMYKLVNTIFKNKYVALIASIFYITFPYSITEVFIRDALAESFVYMFMPMIILGLYHLFYGEKKYFYLYFVIGYIGLINSHLVLAVYFTAFIIIYLILNLKNVFKREKLVSLIISSIIILFAVLSFIIPMLQHKALNIYTVFESDRMANYGTTINSTLTLDEFVLQKGNEEFSNVKYYQNLLGLAMAIITIVLNKKIIKTDAEKNFFKYLIILVFITVFLMSNLFPWRFMPKMVIMIQFAWRLETILTIALSILAALVVRNIDKRKFKIMVFALIIVFNAITVYNTYNFDMIKRHNIEDIDISNYGMGWEKEYLPLVTLENIEYFNNRTEDIIVKQGSANIDIKENYLPKLKAEITNCDTETTIELPRIYYLGYNMILKKENGKEEKLDIYMNDNGFIETRVNNNGILELDYKGTVANKIASSISMITIILSIVVYIYVFKKKENILKE